MDADVAASATGTDARGAATESAALHSFLASAIRICICLTGAPCARPNLKLAKAIRAAIVKVLSLIVEMAKGIRLRQTLY